MFELAIGRIDIEELRIKLTAAPLEHLLVFGMIGIEDEDKLPVSDYLSSRVIIHNINQLSYLRTQIIELDTQINTISMPKLEFAKGLPPELSGYVATRWQLKQEWVANLSETPAKIKSLDIEKLSKLMDGDAASALRSEEAFIRLQTLVQLASEYNHALGELVYVYGSPQPQAYYWSTTLRRGASRESAEIFISRARELVPRMKQSIVGLEPIISDEVQAARTILKY